MYKPLQNIHFNAYSELRGLLTFPLYPQSAISIFCNSTGALYARWCSIMHDDDDPLPTFIPVYSFSFLELNVD